MTLFSWSVWRGLVLLLSVSGLEIPILIPDFTLLEEGEIWDEHGNFQPLSFMTFVSCWHHFVLQQLDYIEYIDHYHEFIKAFHVKDSEFNPTGKKGAFGGYNDWGDRAGRYRSLGDGQIDFKTIFSKLTQYGCDVWAVMEWECCIKSPEQGAREGAKFIQDHIIKATTKTFDDFAGAEIDHEQLKRILGL